MQIVNVSGDARYLPALDRDIEDGQVFDVSDELGASLLEQPTNWAIPTITAVKE